MGWANSVPGKLTGYDCPDCMNRGYFTDIADGYEVSRQCRCMAIRRAKKNIEKSGLGELLESCTFDSFKTFEPWQTDIKATAERFLDDSGGKWFLFCGQVGAGKTHLCTAIVGEMLKRGIPARYMRWKDESTKLKAMVTDGEYGGEIETWKTAKVLYIDDFLKVQSGKSPTQADIVLAFEILNHRYISRDLVTIISSEHTVERMIDFDQAVGSRIYERSKGYSIAISGDAKKNYRLYGGR